MCSMCSCRPWAGSRAVARVVWARISDSVMDTWKYRVPFSNHCCFQCTWEISSPVPDISAENKERGKKDNVSAICLFKSVLLSLSCYRKIKHLNSIWAINQRYNVTVWSCISIPEQWLSAHLKSWTEFLSLRNCVCLCSWLGKSYCQARCASIV